MGVKMQDQMDVLDPIYITPDMTEVTKMTILNIHFPLPNETCRCS